jgi:hypothetical protein
MMGEIKDSYIELIKSISNVPGNELSMTRNEYQLLIEELWINDQFLKDTYPHYSMLPTIYTLYGVKLIVI